MYSALQLPPFKIERKGDTHVHVLVRVSDEHLASRSYPPFQALKHVCTSLFSGDAFDGLCTTLAKGIMSPMKTSYNKHQIRCMVGTWLMNLLQTGQTCGVSLARSPQVHSAAGVAPPPSPTYPVVAGIDTIFEVRGGQGRRLELVIDGQ